MVLPFPYLPASGEVLPGEGYGAGRRWITMIPLVTVGIPTYNRLHGLKKTLECITAQTYKNLEIIVSDNHSPCSDVTETMIKSFALKDNRIRYFMQMENHGPAYNYKFVLQQAKGKYFMWASDDDEWEPGFISRLVGGLEYYPELAVVMCDIIEEDAQDKIIRYTRYPLALDPDYSPFRLCLYAASHDQITHLMYGLHRTDILRKFTANYDDSFASDMLILNEMLMCERMGTVDIPFFRKRVHSYGTAQRYSDETIGKAYRDPFNFLRLFLRFGPYLMRSPHIPFRRKFWVPFMSVRQALWIIWIYPRQIYNYFVEPKRVYITSFDYGSR